jgi:GNAT superfamily N-acetyltransferase
MTISFKNHENKLALSILQEVANWLLENDKELWKVETVTEENIINDLTRNNMYVVYVDDEPAATFVLQWEDPLYWPSIPANVSGFIHKLAIRRKFAGQNLFAPILAFCKEECLKRNIHDLRLDTDFERPKLLNLYDRHGFKRVGLIEVFDAGRSFNCMLYEMSF